MDEWIDGWIDEHFHFSGLRRMNQLTRSPQPQTGLRPPHVLKLEAAGYSLNQDYSTWGEVFLLTNSGTPSVKEEMSSVL